MFIQCRQSQLRFMGARSEKRTSIVVVLKDTDVLVDFIIGWRPIPVLMIDISSVPTPSGPL